MENYIKLSDLFLLLNIYIIITFERFKKIKIDLHGLNFENELNNILHW